MQAATTGLSPLEQRMASQGKEPAQTQVGAEGSPTASLAEEERLIELKNRIHQALIAELNVDVTSTEQVNENEAEMRQALEEVARRQLAEIGAPLPARQREMLLEDVWHEVTGYGPLQILLDREDISEVIVNAPKEVFCELNGRIQPAVIDGRRIVFDDDQHTRRIIDKILAPIGRRVNDRTPMADGRLPDGSRVNVIIPPLAIKGSSITIRKFKQEKLGGEDLVNFGTWTEQMHQFLRACVISKLNIVIAGGTGSGKTTLLNIMSSFIPEHERVITVEDAAELQLHQPDLVSLEARPPNIEGEGEVTIRDLVKNCLRMRPDRVVVGECRGGEALDMLQAMNTGHDGSLTTVHANSPRDTISRLETLCLMSGLDLPLRVISKQIASAVHLIVQQARLSDGSRKVINVTELQGMEGEQILLQDVFVFERSGVDENGKIIGRHRSTGFRPKCMEQLRAAGQQVPADLFMS